MSSQLIVPKKGCCITSLASSGPPPRLKMQKMLISCGYQCCVSMIDHSNYITFSKFLKLFLTYINFNVFCLEQSFPIRTILTPFCLLFLQYFSLAVYSTTTNCSSSELILFTILLKTKSQLQRKRKQQQAQKEKQSKTV